MHTQPTLEKFISLLLSKRRLYLLCNFKSSYAYIFISAKLNAFGKFNMDNNKVDTTGNNNIFQTSVGTE